MIDAVPPLRWRAAIRACLLAAPLLLGACSHVQGLKPSNWHAHWPWRHAPATPEAPVIELLTEGADGTTAPVLPQTWDRNTLRVALNGLAGEGEVKLRPVQGHGWPIRLEFAVQPGSFAHLEVRAEQRVILAVPETGGVTVLAVPQGVYAPNTPDMTLRYGP